MTGPVIGPRYLTLVVWTKRESEFFVPGNDCTFLLYPREIRNRNVLDPRASECSPSAALTIRSVLNRRGYHYSQRTFDRTRKLHLTTARGNSQVQSQHSVYDSPNAEPPCVPSFATKALLGHENGSWQTFGAAREFSPSKVPATRSL